MKKSIITTIAVLLCWCGVAWGEPTLAGVSLSGVGVKNAFESETSVQINRIEADGGTIVDLNWMDTVIKTLKDQGIYTSCKFLADANFAYKNTGSGVSTLYDISGNNNDATQGTDANRPVWTAAQQNGKAGIVFDGTDSFMTATSAVTDVRSIVFIYKSNNLKDYAHVLAGESYADFHGGASSRWFYYSYPYTKARNGTFWTNGVSKVYADFLRTLTTQLMVSSFSENLNWYQFSNWGDQTYRRAEGIYFDFSVFNAALTTTQRQAVESMLNTYYAIY